MLRRIFLTIMTAAMLFSNFVTPMLADSRTPEIGEVGIRVDIINGGRDIQFTVVEQTETGLRSLETATRSCSERAVDETCQQFALRLFNQSADEPWACEFTPNDDCYSYDPIESIAGLDHPLGPNVNCVSFLIWGWCPANY